MGLSFGKLLLLAVIIFAVWYTVKRPSLIEAVTRAARREMTKHRPRRAPPGPVREAEDLVKCERCGAYAAVGAPPCDRADCPRRTNRRTPH